MLVKGATGITIVVPALAARRNAYLSKRSATFDNIDINHSMEM